MEFRDLKINEKTLTALVKLGYNVPTEVQEKTIPEIIAGQNLLVRSQTGTGKTAAFGIGLIERITAHTSKMALILTPTRELAVQVCKEISAIGQDHHGLRVRVVYGGQSINVQADSLHGGVDILVATPGRLLDLSRRGVLRIGDFNAVVLDEADAMLDMGFRDEVTEILDQLPQHRLTLLVSATIEESILDMAAKYVPHSKTIEVGEIEIVSSIHEEHVEATERERFPRLIEVLRQHEKVKTLIFRETKLGAERLQERLWQRGVRCGLLQGDMTQARRTAVMNDFKEGRLNVLVATNVAARGLHVENLGLIVNYDRAQSEEIHLHRVGRTGRMGAEGKAINFVVRKESREERMNADHPDFAWMKGGLDSYRSSSERRPFRRGPPHGRPHGGPSYGGRERGTGYGAPHEGQGRPHHGGGSQHGAGTGHPQHGSHAQGEGQPHPQGEHRPHRRPHRQD
jgi:ATP-dependent RNA helicase DeaD